ncbi:MAG: polysaccharide deacetylase family protein, partial [Chloroflexi bacterium]|nr:polysaccharide deacetylase family protein [Chloroflexota bacterium]
GGYLLTAHANLTVDDPNSSGFSWEHPFGGKRIGEIFAHTTGLQMVKEIQTPLYRVQLFKRQIPKRFQLRAAKPEIIKYDYQSTVLPAHVSQYAVWQGTDQFNRPPENTNRLPILMYHRVAPTGDALSRYRVTPQAFEDQLRYLRESGYYTVDFDTWQTAAKNKTPLPGKAICLTFDDGYLDFYTYAFPLLKKYNFTATVFIVTECVGQTNAWDAVYGEEVPLMNWEQILELQAQGIDLGSHTANHPHLTALSPTEIVKQAISSRATLSEKLNKPIMSIAYPYGDMDELVQHLIGAAGYVHAVTTYHAFCEFSNDLIAMPRLEVKGDDTIADFAAILNPTLPST